MDERFPLEGMEDEVEIYTFEATPIWIVSRFQSVCTSPLMERMVKVHCCLSDEGIE